tara:strand:- start:2608 stop:3144 length:537 start_codon:yes stop_codon:yes gene_type:complete
MSINDPMINSVLKYGLNVECDDKITNSASCYDSNIIPNVFYNSVISKNKIELFENIKNNPKLTLAVLNFYYNTLFMAFNFRKNAKHGSPFTIKWQLNNDEKITMNFKELVDYYNFITLNKRYNTNFGYMISIIENYISLLKQGVNLVKKKQPANYYYYLGINIKNNLQYDLFSRQFLS